MLSYCAFLIVIISSICFGQTAGDTTVVRHDSTIVFGTMEKPVDTNANQSTFSNAMGANLLISTNGFGLGTFFRHEYSDELSGFIDFSISEAKDDDEKDFVDYYGNSYTPGKINRFLVLPLFVGIQKRMFKDDIMDNFRPFIGGAAGPTMIYVFPYNQEYFSALGQGTPKYTYGGFLEAGAYFGSERSNLLGLNIRYYYIPYPAGLPSMQGASGVINKTQFGGVSISLTFGGAW